MLSAKIRGESKTRDKGGTFPGRSLWKIEPFWGYFLVHNGNSEGISKITLEQFRLVLGDNERAKLIA